MSRSERAALALLLVALSAAAPGAAQNVLTPPTKLAPFAGHFDTPAQPQRLLGAYQQVHQPGHAHGEAVSTWDPY